MPHSTVMSAVARAAPEKSSTSGEVRAATPIAGDDVQAKAGVASFIESLRLRPLDVGGLTMAHWLEGRGRVTVGLARNGVGHWDVALGASEFTG